MLKFLDNRTHQKPSKSPKKYHPQFLYGNSYQCPKQFQTNFTVFHKSSYLNPYLNYQQSRVRKVPSHSLSAVNPSWKRKVDLQSVQQQKIVSSNADIQLATHSRYLKSFHTQYDQNHGRFRKSRGQFTAFLQKNHKFTPLGPLHGDQRNDSRITSTKQSVWLKPNKSMYESTRRSIVTPDLNMSVRSSISKNSQLLIEKNRIRQNREKVYINYKRSLERRKVDNEKSALFELPRKGPEHELTFFNATKDYGMRYSLWENAVGDDFERDLERFEAGMGQKMR